jgi:hypothetical protein
MRRMLWMVLIGMVGWMVTAGCASQPLVRPQPTTQETRGNADRSFEKLKQEEGERGGAISK